MLVERIARLQFGQQKCGIWTKTICNLEKLLRNLEKKNTFLVNPRWKTGITLMQVKRIAGMFERRQRIGIASKQNNILFFFKRWLWRKYDGQRT